MVIQGCASEQYLAKFTLAYMLARMGCRFGPELAFLCIRFCAVCVVL